MRAFDSFTGASRCKLGRKKLGGSRAGDTQLQKVRRSRKELWFILRLRQCRKAPSPSPSPAPEEADEEYDEASHSKRKAGAKKKTKASKKPKTAQATKSTKPSPTDASTWPESKIADDATVRFFHFPLLLGLTGKLKFNRHTDHEGRRCQTVPSQCKDRFRRIEEPESQDRVWLYRTAVPHA